MAGVAGAAGGGQHGRMQIEAVQGDLTRERVDAIVNAANSTLLGGGGVDGAIHAAAGPALLEECRRVRKTTFREGLPVGEAVATSAGELAARWVVHTVGPSWNRGQRDEAQLASCFTRSLDVAAEVGARSVAFPAVSAGAYGWAMGTVADVAVRTVRAWDAARPGEVDLVRFVLFGATALAEFERALGEVD
ncbi:hypothetical protein Q760_06700 [Cellulomonas cellasea DSM 20118]|uniref:Macro domain-containing protein n=2 Tax=Cellulomonas cellasea TaxID=43670 RepID=A0A0A0BAW2_9CELL|nr:hypothetical protein Q760_06700 [Cellulomonas cellasea DSM 20118]